MIFWWLHVFLDDYDFDEFSRLHDFLDFFLQKYA